MAVLRLMGVLAALGCGMIACGAEPALGVNASGETGIPPEGDEGTGEWRGGATGGQGTGSGTDGWSSQEDGAGEEESGFEEEETGDEEGEDSGEGIGFDAAPAELIVSEIFYNPLTLNDPDGEWFEITNVGKRSIPLNELVVITAGGGGIVQGLGLLMPGASAVITRSAYPSAVPFALVPDGVLPMMALPDAGGHIQLWMKGVLLDVVEYVPGIGPPLVKGAAIQLAPDQFSASKNNNPAHWCVALQAYAPKEHGSPGEWNPECFVPGESGEVGEETGEDETGGDEETGEDGGEVLEAPPVQAPGVPVGPGGGLVITEVLYNPMAVTDEQGEWFEVANTSFVDIDVRGLTVSDPVGDHLIEGASPLWVKSGELAVFAKSGNPQANGGVNPLVVFGGISLNNTGDLLVLRNGPIVLDEVSWSLQGQLTPLEGVSMALDMDAWNSDDNDEFGQWCASAVGFGAGDLGTPGEPNGYCTGTGTGPVGSIDGLVITEMMVDPAAVSDAKGEWFELHNPSNAPLYINGLVIEDAGGQHVISSGTPLQVGAGEHVVLARSGSVSKNGGLDPLYTYSGISLNNGGDHLAIRLGMTVIDKVDYAIDPDFPVVKGHSMQLSPTVQALPTLNDASTAWCVSSIPYGDGDYGSPGLANPPCGAP